MNDVKFVTKNELLHAIDDKTCYNNIMLFLQCMEKVNESFVNSLFYADIDYKRKEEYKNDNDLIFCIINDFYIDNFILIRISYCNSDDEIHSEVKVSDTIKKFIYTKYYDQRDFYMIIRDI